MTYDATVQFKFDATWEPTYGTSSWTDDSILPEEHYLITAPAADLNCKQYFRLFEKFMLCVGMDPKSIHSGAMSLVFNEWTGEEQQRKVCEEYELTMDEDLRGKFEDWKKAEEEFARFEKGPMGTVLEDSWEITDPHGTIVTNGTTSNDSSWEERYWALYRRFSNFAGFTDKELGEMINLWSKTRGDV